MSLTLDQLKLLAASVGFPDPGLAAAVAMAESGGDPCAQGDPNIGERSCTPNGTSKSMGLWQIDTDFHKELTAAELLDALTNAKAAHGIFQESGGNFHAWSTAWEDPVKRTGYLGPRAPVRRWWSPAGPVAVGGNVTGTVAALLVLGGITYALVKAQ